MKKIFTIFALLALICTGTQAQNVVVHSTKTGQNMLTAEQIISKATAGDLYVALQLHTTSSNNYFNKTGNVVSAFDANGTTTWKVVPDDGGYVLQNSDGNYINNATRPMTVGSDIASATHFEPEQVPAEPVVGNIDGSYNWAQAVRWKVLPDKSVWLNANGADATTTVQFNNGTGNWTCWFTYEVTIKEMSADDLAAREEARDKVGEWLSLLQNSKALVTDYSKYSSNALMIVEGDDGAGYPTLIDKNPETYFHSRYSGDKVFEDHYLQAELSEAVSDFHFYSMKRNDNNRPYKILIQGSNDGETWTDITTVEGNELIAKNDYLSGKISATNTYDQIRFTVSKTYHQNNVIESTGTEDQDGGGYFNGHVFFTYAEFWILKSDELTEKAVAYINNLPAAIDMTDEQVKEINDIDQELRNSLVNVTYRIVDEGGNLIYTVPTTEAVSPGATVTLPATYKQTLFYDYNDSQSYTAGSSDFTADFTATAKEDAPFKPSTSFADATWYSLTLSAALNYVTYNASGAQNVQLPVTNADDETTHWAFIGNPYEGFQIVNEAAGSDLVLGSGQTTGAASAGQNVYATMADPGTQDNELWTVQASTNIAGKNGFYIINTENHRLNKRNGTSNISYWTGGYDSGSTFVATKVPGLEELLPEAETLLGELTAGATDVQIGYPTEAALSDFSDAIDDGKKALGGGDEAEALANLKAAIAAVKSPENTNYTPRTDVYYTITSTRGSMVYDPSHSTQVDNTYGNEFLWYSTNLDKEDPNHQWGFIEQDGKYYMYNVGKKQFANVTQGGSYQEGNGDRHSWMFSDSPSSVTLDAGEGNWVATPNVRVRATSEVTGKQYAMSISTGYTGPVIAYDAVNDGGIPMTFAIATTTQDNEVTQAIEDLLNDPTPYFAELGSLVETAEQYPVGEKLSQYSAPADFNDVLATAQATLQDEGATKAQLVEDITALRTALESMELNLPQANTFFRIKSVAQDSYVSSTLDTSVSAPYSGFYTTGAAADDVTTIWLYDGEHLLNYATGLYTVSAGPADAGADGGDEVTFSEATNGKGMYWIKPSSANYWYGGTPTLDRWSTPATNENTRFQLEEVTELPITLTEVNGKYYATFSSPVAISSIEGATTHKIEIDDDKAKYSEYGETGLPANMGILLIGETAEATAYIGDCEATAETGMTAQIPSIVDGGSLYFLGLGDSSEKLGFYPLASGVSSGGFKACIDSSASGKESFELVDANDITGVEAIENGETTDDGAVYNLQGQRVTKATKGVFIQNGRKVIVK